MSLKTTALLHGRYS